MIGAAVLRNTRRRHVMPASQHRSRYILIRSTKFMHPDYHRVQARHDDKQLVVVRLHVFRLLYLCASKGAVAPHFPIKTSAGARSVG